jgi:hypothetical protein
VKRTYELYVDSPDAEDPVRLRLVGGPAGSSMLHSDIVEAVRVSRSKEWLRWLMDTLGVSTILRVANSSGTITEEFAYFLENRLLSVSLRPLVKHWRTHFPSGSVPEGVSWAISSAQVEYGGRQKKKLGALSLACKELMPVSPKELPFLHLPDIENESWRPLRTLALVSQRTTILCAIVSISGGKSRPRRMTSFHYTSSCRDALLEMNTRSGMSYLHARS